MHTAAVHHHARPAEREAPATATTLCVCSHHTSTHTVHWLLLQQATPGSYTSSGCCCRTPMRVCKGVNRASQPPSSHYTTVRPTCWHALAYAAHTHTQRIRTRRHCFHGRRHRYHATDPCGTRPAQCRLAGGHEQSSYSEGQQPGAVQQPQRLLACYGCQRTDASGACYSALGSPPHPGAAPSNPSPACPTNTARHNAMSSDGTSRPQGGSSRRHGGNSGAAAARRVPATPCRAAQRRCRRRCCCRCCC
jgi:hypothetical protein